MNTWFIELDEFDRRKLIDELYISYTKKTGAKNTTATQVEKKRKETVITHWWLEICSCFEAHGPNHLNFID